MTISSDEQFAEKLRGFGPVGILAVIVILAAGFLASWIGALLVLLWARESRTPCREIGYAWPKNPVLSAAIGIAFGISFKLVMKSVAMPLLGAPAINPAYHFLAGDPAALPGVIFAVTLGAGFGEETMFRGYLFERLGKLLGSGGAARVAIVLVTSFLFAIAHLPDQGVAGAEQAAVTGLVFGSIFAVTRRLWMLMWAHAAFDLTAVAIIFWDQEARVAHWFFR
jgi:membrane protease YdiL (CAAX protease family)